MQMQTVIYGEALMDCIVQPDGSFMPFMGGSPYNLARVVGRQAGWVGYLNPLSSDRFGQLLKGQLVQDGVHVLSTPSHLPTSLALVTIEQGQPSYSFYREGVADRGSSVEAALEILSKQPPGILHTGSLLLVPPENTRTEMIVRGAKALGWVISMDLNLRPLVTDNLPAYVQAVKQVMALADWIKASDEDLRVLGYPCAGLQDAAALAAEFERQGARRIALTFGDQGAYLRVEGQSAQGRAVPVDVVDTVGAGDTFWGTCLADWAATPENAAHRTGQTLLKALTAAALNCGNKGCVPPTGRELSDRLGG